MIAITRGMLCSGLRKRCAAGHSALVSGWSCSGIGSRRFSFPRRAGSRSAVNAQARRGFLYHVPQMHGHSGEILDSPPTRGGGKRGPVCIRPVVQGAIQIGQGGTSARRSGRSGPASKSSHKSYRTCCFAKSVQKIPADANWLFSLTAGRMRQNYPQECVLPITATLSARLLPVHWRIKVMVRSHSSSNSTVKH